MKFAFVQMSLREKKEKKSVWEQIGCIAVLKSSIKKHELQKKAENKKQMEKKTHNKLLTNSIFFFKKRPHVQSVNTAMLM